MITTWSRGHVDHHMPEAILTKFAAQVATHPWWQARSNLILAILHEYKIQPGARILDAGCGWGETFQVLEARKFEVTGLDISRQALERLDRPHRNLIEADLTQELQSEPTIRPRFDAILALDLIEHVDDPASLLSRLSGLLAPGGYLIVNVPAMPELFSEFDDANGHRRRYEPESLLADLRNASLEVERLFYWNAWALPLFNLRRKQKRGPRVDDPLKVYERHLALPPAPFPWLFRQAFALEHARALRGQLKRGTSLMAVARNRIDAFAHEPSQAKRG